MSFLRIDHRDHLTSSVIFERNVKFLNSPCPRPHTALKDDRADRPERPVRPRQRILPFSSSTFDDDRTNVVMPAPVCSSRIASPIGSYGLGMGAAA